MNPIPLIKFVGAWFCIIAAVVLLVLGHTLFGLPGVLAILAIAFAQAPTSWS
jgi:hypothetical protein